MALTDSLVAYYKLDGGTFTDSSGNGYTLTNSGTSSTTGKIGDAADFSSGDDLTETTGPSGYVNTNTFTISMWIKTTGTGYKTFFCRATTANVYGTNWFQESNGDGGNIVYWVRKSGAHALRYGNITTINDGNWHHIVFTYDGTTCNGYVDNVADAGTNFNASNAQDATATTSYFGTYFDGASNPFIGQMDEIGIWSRVLASSEVSELYNSGSGLTYPFTATGWGEKISGIANASISKVDSVAKASISKINGV